MKLTIKLIAANALIIVCVIIGSFLPGLWTGEGGRDFRPQALNAGILILIASIILRYKFKWQSLQMLIALLPTQLIILLCISYFSGFTGTEIFDSFNLLWLLFIDLFVVVPWIIGIFIGNFILKKSSE